MISNSVDINWQIEIATYDRYLMSGILAHYCSSQFHWFLLERERNWLIVGSTFHAGHYVDLMVTKQNWRFLSENNRERAWQRHSLSYTRPSEPWNMGYSNEQWYLVKTLQQLSRDATAIALMHKLAFFMLMWLLHGIVSIAKDVCHAHYYKFS